MPDQDRKPPFLHTFSRDPGAGVVRCSTCSGFGVTFQADCVCCGREVVTCQDTKADEITNAVKALSIKTEALVPQVSDPPQNATQSVHEIHGQIPVPARPRSSNGRQRRDHPPGVRSHSTFQRCQGAGRDIDGLGSVGLTYHAGSSRSPNRICQQPQYFVRPSSSRRGGVNVTRGSSRAVGRGMVAGHHNFKGVRTRKGVRGFMVEIRPPKWKKTIWLGTYNTSIEAAGAYDAGVFYTKKSNTKYNFHSSAEAFPPLPSHLRLDRADSMDELKLFVQSQARAAARRVGNALATPQAAPDHREALANPVASADANNNINNVEPSTSESCLTGDPTASGEADLPTASSSSDVVEIDSEYHIPMDLEYLELQCLREETAEETAENMIFDYTNYWNQQGPPTPPPPASI